MTWTIFSDGKMIIWGTTPIHLNCFFICRSGKKSKIGIVEQEMVGKFPPADFPAEFIHILAFLRKAR
ncbi:hypothetical protein BLX87_00660 [Bacillus sp. VT-16-64]|nr:hypothetical protein BLX87_00660 [Bacillus sp. VT-16-64]